MKRNNNVLRNIVTTAVSLMLILGLVQFNSTDVAAKKITKESQWVKAGKKIYEWGFYGIGYGGDGKRSSGSLQKRDGAFEYPAVNSAKDISSSDSSVITAKSGKGSLKGYIVYTLKKSGKANITYSGLDVPYDEDTGEPDEENAEEAEVTEKHTVYIYKNPLKSFKIGSKDYKSNFKKEPFYNQKATLKGKVKVSVKSGWKLKELRFVKNGISGVLGKSNGDCKKVKNGDVITLSDGKALEAVIYNKKKDIYLSTVIINNYKYFNVGPAG